jgi:hypothetical protein
MPKKRRKRKEIVVAAPSFSSKKDALLRDTTGAEAVDVFKVCGKIGRCLSGLMIAVGALLSLISVVSILASIDFPFLNPLSVGTLGFLGAINIFCGLILLAKK